MGGLAEARELAAQPDLWQVELRDGRQITVIAHAYSVEGEEVVFSLLFRGRPNFEIVSLRIPLDLLPTGFSHQCDVGGAHSTSLDDEAANNPGAYGPDDV